MKLDVKYKPQLCCLDDSNKYAKVGDKALPRWYSDLKHGGLPDPVRVSHEHVLQSLQPGHQALGVVQAVNSEDDLKDNEFH